MSAVTARVEVFDGFRQRLASNGAQSYRDVPTDPSFAFDQPGANVSPGTLQNGWRRGMNRNDTPLGMSATHTHEIAQDLPAFLKS